MDTGRLVAVISSGGTNNGRTNSANMGFGSNRSLTSVTTSAIVVLTTFSASQANEFAVLVLCIGESCAATLVILSIGCHNFHCLLGCIGLR